MINDLCGGGVLQERDMDPRAWVETVSRPQYNIVICSRIVWLHCITPAGNPPVLKDIDYSRSNSQRLPLRDHLVDAHFKKSIKQ